MKNSKNYNGIKIEDLEHLTLKVIKSILESEKESFVIYLEGEMGAGKTTFAKYFAKSLGITDHVQSPTFTLMREYDLQNNIKEDKDKNKYNKLLHIDAYRFEDRKEGHILKLSDNKNGNIVLIEWPQNMYAPDADIIISIEKINGDENVDLRNIKIETL